MRYNNGNIYTGNFENNLPHSTNDVLNGHIEKTDMIEYSNGNKFIGSW